MDLANPSERLAFIEVVDDIYRGDPNYVTPLRVEQKRFLDPRNPSLASLEIGAFVARKAGRVVGRITGHIDRAYDRYQGVRTGWFGFFESVDDRTVAHSLLARAVDWVAERGVTEIIGPANFTTNHQVGLLVENFARPPFVEMTYNPSYYEPLITSFGFGRAKDLHAYFVDLEQSAADGRFERFQRVAERALRRSGITLRTPRMRDFDLEVERLFSLYNATWQKNWGFVPVSALEFAAIARDLKTIIVPELVLLAEHEGNPVGLSVTLPNVNEKLPRDGRLFPFGWLKLFGLKRTRQARLFVLGVHPRFRKRGIESLLAVETALRARSLGYAGGEIGWTLEDNHLVNRAAEAMGAKLDRRYRLFGMTL